MGGSNRFSDYLNRGEVKLLKSDILSKRGNRIMTVDQITLQKIAVEVVSDPGILTDNRNTLWKQVNDGGEPFIRPSLTSDSIK